MTLTPDPERDLAFSRTLPASRDLVWAAWTDPAQLRRWIAPAPAVTEEADIDPRPGGTFRLVMRTEDETFLVPGMVLHADPGRRLVWTDCYAPGWAMRSEGFMTAILTFSDAEGGTRYDVLVRHATPEARQRHEEMGFFHGWGLATDQLGTTASALAGPEPDREILLTRLVGASPALCWKAWTDPGLLPGWFGPAGYTCETESIDLRPGGHWRFTMAGEGQRFPNLHRFGEMEPETRLTYDLLGADETALHAHVAVTFAAEGEGTRVTMRMTLADMPAAVALGYGALEKGYETLAKLGETARSLPEA